MKKANPKGPAPFDREGFLSLGGAPAAVQKFDRAAFLGSSAGSDAEPMADAAPEAPGLIESGLRGIKQGVTLGFGDEISGALESLLTSKTYRQARDEARASDTAARTAHPWGYGIGEVVGGFATPGLGAATGAVKGVGLAAHAARGAITGGIAGIGSSESETVGGVTSDAAKSAVLGAGLGAVLGKVSQKLVHGAEGRSDERLLSDIGNRANKTVRDKISGFSEGTLETARKFGLDKVARDPDALLEAAAASRKQVGQAIGDTYEAVDKAFIGVKSRDVVKALGEAKKKYSSPADSSLRKQIDSLQSGVKEQWGSGATDRVPLAKVNELVGKLEAQGFASADLSPRAAVQLKRDVAGAIDDVLDRRMGEIQEFAGHVKATPGAGKFESLSESVTAADQLAGLKGLNSNYRALRLIEKAAEQRANLGAFAPNGIRQIASSGLETASLLGSIATANPLPYLATKVGIPLAKTGARQADEVLARISRAAASGEPTAKLIQDAMERGVPRSAIATAIASSSQVGGEGG